MSGRTFHIVGTPNTNNSSSNLLVRRNSGEIEMRTFAYQNQSTTLDNWTSASGSTGFVVQTAPGSWNFRAILAGTGISVTNGTGISGSPTIALPTSATTVLRLWSAGTGSNSVVGGQSATALSTNSLTFGLSNTNSASNSAVIAGKTNNIISGVTNSGIVGGNGNVINSNQCGILGGSGNDLSGSGSVILGGIANVGFAGFSSIIGSSQSRTNAIGSVILGGQNGVADNYGEIVQSHNTLSSLNAQTSSIVLGVVTTNATQTSLLLGDGTTGIGIGTNESWSFNVKVHCVITSATNIGSTRTFEYKVKAKNVAGTTTATSIITGINPDAGETGTAAFAITVNTITSNRLQIRVTGAASTTVSWIAKVEAIKIEFA